MSLRADLDARGIAWADTWLSAKECARIERELDYTFWRRSQVVEAGSRGTVTRESTERTSRSTDERWFGEELRSRVDDLEGRLRDELSVDPILLERWQAVSYEPGGRFGLHHDGGSFADDPAGERVLTFLLCLRAPASGGATYFPDLDILLEPLAGRLVVWNNLDEDGLPDQRVRHAATPVHEGRKLMLTTWSRQRPARPEPAVEVAPPETPS